MFDTKSKWLDMFKTWVLCIIGRLKRKINKRMHNNYVKLKDTCLEHITVHFFLKDDNLVLSCHIQHTSKEIFALVYSSIE